MELYDNHIQIYISILQVLQSLSRDNHGIFISLVLFETWLCRVNNLQFFKAWRLTSPVLFPNSIVRFPNPIVWFPNPKWSISKPKPRPFCSILGPRQLFHLGQKQDLLPPQRSWEEPPVTARPAPPGSAWETLPGTIEKLQFVCAYVWTLSMLSCLQVNLSWGVCHGSSWFCI